MNVKTFFQAFYLSFFDTSFYQSVAKQWTGSGFLLLFVMLFAYGLVQGIDGWVTCHSYLTKDGQKIVDQLPGFTFKNGTFSMDRPGPVVIKDSTGTQTLFVLDPEHKVPSLKDANTILLVTDKKLIYRDDDVEKTEDLSQLSVFVKEYSGNPATVMTVLNQAAIWIGVALFVFAWLGGFVVDLIRIVLLSAVIGFVSKERTFTERTRLLVCATIPAHVTLAVGTMFGNVTGTFGGLVSAAIFTIYAVLAFKWTRPEPALVAPTVES